MLLITAWLLFVLCSLCIFDHLAWLDASWVAPYYLVFLGVAVILWMVFCFQYYQSVRWIKKMSKGLGVDPSNESYQKVKKKWSRMMVQLFMITFLLVAYFGLEIIQLFNFSFSTSTWIHLGVWIVWFHSLIWFTLSWNRDQRLKKHLEREVTFELEQDAS